MLVIFQLDGAKKHRIAIDPEQIVTICEISKDVTNIRLAINDAGWSVRGGFDAVIQAIVDATSEGELDVQEASNDK